MSQEIDHVETASCTQGDEKIGALEVCTPPRTEIHGRGVLEHCGTEKELHS